MILLTATPHSGVEEAFLSLLGLINPDFAKFDLAQMEEKERITLSQHFIQRRRADIKTWLGEDNAFPRAGDGGEYLHALPCLPGTLQTGV